MRSTVRPTAKRSTSAATAPSKPIQSVTPTGASCSRSTTSAAKSAPASEHIRAVLNAAPESGPVRSYNRSMFESIDDTQERLAERGYVADRSLATAIYLCMRLEKPLLLEGEAGVGKTEVAKVLAATLDAELIRLQGYEGIDVSHAVYEWNYARQIMAIRLAEARQEREDLPDVFGPDFLIERP